MTSGTFSEKYKFKRLLQTDSEIITRYKTKDTAINSIPAVKDIAIYEGPDSCEYVPSGIEVSATHAVQHTMLLRGTAEWPRRVIFPEQARQLYEDGRPMWSINVTVKSSTDYASNKNYKSYIVRIQRLDAPVIASHDSRQGGWRPSFTPVAPDKIRLIENDTDQFYYLLDGEKPPEDQDPWDVWSAGLVPNVMAEFNCCFYDREVAHLYAESLRAEVKRIEEMHFKN